MKFYLVPNRHLYTQDGKETNPVIGKVINVGDGVETSLIGKYVVVHHNLIFNPEYLIKEEGGINTSVLPYDRWIMGWIDDEGDLQPLNHNVICERIDVKMVEQATEASHKTEENLMKVLRSDMEGVQPGETILVYKYADYEVVYMWNNELRRKIVVTEGDVLGFRISFIPENLTEEINFMQPLKDRIIVKQDPAPETSGDFVVPGTADIKTLSGIVVAVGPGEYAKETGVLIPMELKGGEHVHFGKNSGTKVQVDGEEYIVMFEREVLLIV